MRESDKSFTDDIRLPSINGSEESTEEIPGFLKGGDETGTTEVPSFHPQKRIEVEDTEDIPPVKEKPAPAEKKESGKKKSIWKDIVSAVLFFAMTVVLLFVGINIAGLFMNSGSGSTAVSEKTPVSSAAPTEEATPVPTATPSLYTGTLTVDAESITMRSEPSLDGEAIGSVSSGETYQVMDTQRADGYTWYEIGADSWIASDGTWVTYTEN